MIIDTVQDLSGERTTKRPADCARCGIHLVPQATQRPPEGYARYGAYGMCKRCYNQGHRSEPRPSSTPTGQQKVRWDTTALLGFLAPRRRRLGADGSLAEFPSLDQMLGGVA